MDDLCSRVKRLLAEVNAKGRIASALNGTIRTNIGVTLSPQRGNVVSVHLDATVIAKPGDEMAYQYQGKWIRSACFSFGLPITEACVLKDDALKARLDEECENGLRQLREFVTPKEAVA